MSKPRSPRFNQLRQGYVNAFQQAIAFHRWWESRRDPKDPTCREIAERWEISRATADRWRGGYLAAIGRELRQ